MAILTTLPPSETTHKVQPTKRRRKHHSQNPKLKQHQQQPSSSSWDQFKNLLKCKQMDITVSGSDEKIHPNNTNNNGYSKLSSSCSSICSFKDVANGINTTTRVVHRADNSPESSTAGQDSGQRLRRKKHITSSNSTTAPPSVRSNGHGSYTSASRGMQFRKLSGCYECHAIIDPSRSPFFILFFI